MNKNRPQPLKSGFPLHPQPYNLCMFDLQKKKRPEKTTVFFYTSRVTAQFSPALQPPKEKERDIKR